MPRLAAVVLALAFVASLAALPAEGTTPRGSGPPSCLRGSWVASSAESDRVLRALVPVDGLDSSGTLYMIFRDGMFQYGSRNMKVTFNPGGDLQLISRSRFFSLARYTARPGVLTLSAGEATIEHGSLTGIKDGKSFTVPGPAPKTRRTPGGSTPFQCRGATLKMKLPRFASLEWITLRRGTP